MNIKPDLLKQIIADQHEEHQLPSDYYARTQEANLETLASTKEILVLTGLRRAGKSVLLQRIRQQATESDYYFNFEDERLVNFSSMDFQILQMMFIEMFGVQTHFYFDEIQNIPGWEMFIRRLYNADNKVFITGSNANLFSADLGTRLTGRYISVAIYPLSFKELAQTMLPDSIAIEHHSTTMMGKIRHLFQQYLISGGIPEFVKHGQIDYLRTLYESILYRDIIVRYKINNAASIKQLVFFLASNCSKEMTYNALRKVLDIRSATTVAKYCEYLANSYLCFFVNRYSDSVKAQLSAPKKVYFIDHAIARALGFRFSEDNGRMLENIVFIELKRRQFDIYYHREKKECDFIIRQGAHTIAAIQVCQHLYDPKTKQREIAGLIEALKRFSLKEGYLLTDNTESIEQHTNDGSSYTVHIIPIWKWLLNPYIS